MQDAYPLQWPQGWPRCDIQGGRRYGHFKTMGRDITVSAATLRVLNQMRLMGVPAREVIISTNIPLRLDGTPRSNQPEPLDRGAAVYWRKSATDPAKVMAIDLYTKVADNLAAIAATLEAMRAIERHGGAQILERAFTGFTALAAPEAFDAWAVLGLRPGAGRDDIERKFRELAKRHHPDAGGNAEQFHRIQKAREQLLERAGP